MTAILIGVRWNLEATLTVRGVKHFLTLAGCLCFVIWEPCPCYFAHLFTARLAFLEFNFLSFWYNQILICQIHSHQKFFSILKAISFVLQSFLISFVSGWFYFLSSWSAFQKALAYLPHGALSVCSRQLTLKRRSLIHAEWILYWMRQGSSFFLYVWLSSFPGVTCWTGCLFSNAYFGIFLKYQVAIVGFIA